MTNSELAILFFIQLAVILGVCRLVGFLAKRVGQPQVVGEMIAGVLLGLMELILLNIGLQQGIITPTLFTMLVLMAIVTTLMASPLFESVYGRFRARRTDSLGQAIDVRVGSSAE